MDTISLNSRIHHEIVAFDTWVRQTEAEKAARRILVECIESLVKDHIASDATVKLFGSSVTGLCLPTSYVFLSHVDLALDLSRRA